MESKVMSSICQFSLPFGGRAGQMIIEQDESYLENEMTFSQEELSELYSLKGHRRLEWLASRYLLDKLLPWDVRQFCSKDEHGKPHLVDQSKYISLSHSRERVAAIISDVECGIDIQNYVNKIGRIRSKFVNSYEEDRLLGKEEESKLLHIIWGAKECLYKAYGRRQISLTEHIFVDIEEFATSGQIFGHMDHSKYSATYVIEWRELDNFMLVWAYNVEV